MPYLQLAPWQLGTRFTFIRQLLAQPSLAFQGSKDCNPRSATPSDVRDNWRIIISLADHGETALWLFFSGMDRSVRDDLSRTSWRFPYIASCSGNVPPCWVFNCQGRVCEQLRELQARKIIQDFLQYQRFFSAQFLNQTF